MRRKIQFYNQFTELSLEINYINSYISFEKKLKKLVFTLQIGVHFFSEKRKILLTRVPRAYFSFNNRPMYRPMTMQMSNLALIEKERITER
jgi:hypothetical protein